MLTIRYQREVVARPRPDCERCRRRGVARFHNRTSEPIPAKAGRCQWCGDVSDADGAGGALVDLAAGISGVVAADGDEHGHVQFAKVSRTFRMCSSDFAGLVRDVPNTDPPRE